MRTLFSRISMMAVLISWGIAPAQNASAPADSATNQVPLEVFRAGKLIAWPGGDLFPEEERRSGGEGWVDLAMMIDTRGKPFEIGVLRSTGNKQFEDAAIKYVAQIRYEPATVSGHPVEWATEYRVTYRLHGMPRGESAAFIKAYKDVATAIDAGDRSAADAAMAKLKIGNLYEDAFFGMASFYYARAWGSESDRLAGLRRAIGNDKDGSYLPAAMLGVALANCLRLELNVHEYAEAMQTWERVQKARVDPAVLAKFKPVMDQVLTLKSNNIEYSVDGTLSDGYWYLGLFKRHFRIEVRDGALAEVKLLCERQYIGVTFDPTILYQVNGRSGDCRLRLEGTPGTRVRLYQS